MPSSYSPNLRIELIASGEQANTWGNTTNTNLGTLIEQSICGYVSLSSMTDANYTLTALNGASDQARQMYLDVPAGVTLTATRFIIAPAVSKVYVVRNNSTGGQSVTIATATSGVTGVTIPSGRVKTVACDGTNFTEVITSMDKLYLDTAITYAGSAANQAVTKTYVDSGFFRLAGNNTVTGNTTFSGTVTLPSTTPTGYQATSFDYVNTNYLWKSAGGPSTQDVYPYLRLQYTPVDAADAVPKTYVDSNFVTLTSTQTISGIKTFSSNVALSGGLTQLTLPNAPVTDTDATNKLYVNNQVQALANQISAFTLSSSNAATLTFTQNGVPNLTSVALGNGNVILTVTSSGTAGVLSISSGTTQLSVNPAGGTGNVTLSLDTTSANGLATKTYVGSQGYVTSTSGTAYDSARLNGQSAGYYATASSLSGYATTSSLSNYVAKSGNQSITGSASSGNPSYLGIADSTGAYAARMGQFYSASFSGNVPYFGSYVATGSPSGGRAPVVLDQWIGTTQYSFIIADTSGNVLIPSLAGGGAVSATAVTGQLTVSSDKNLKVEDGFITDGIAAVEALQPRYFYWKDKEGNADPSQYRQLGFFAQEVQEVVPEASPTGLGIYDRALIAMLVKAVQELSAEVKALKGE